LNQTLTDQPGPTTKQNFQSRNSMARGTSIA
jgi:hypothetical protein